MQTGASTPIGVTVNAGAIEMVETGGVASGVTVLSGGILQVDGGAASVYTIASGGTLILGLGTERFYFFLMLAWEAALRLGASLRPKEK